MGECIDAELSHIMTPRIAFSIAKRANQSDGGFEVSVENMTLSNTVCPFKCTLTSWSDTSSYPNPVFFLLPVTPFDRDRKSAKIAPKNLVQSSHNSDVRHDT